MRGLCIVAVMAAAVGLSPGGTAVAQAETVEFVPTDPPSADKRSPARKQPSPQTRSDSGQGGQGRVYTYTDGDRTVRIRLESDLEVSGDGSVARSSGEHIVTRDSSRRRSTGQPVFRSESSGTLMTLPGGVLLVLDAEWSKAETNAFFARNRIKLNRVSALDIAANSFFVETAPGFPSLDLANTLAAQDGVHISSPNWWREHTTK